MRDRWWTTALAFGALLAGAFLAVPAGLPKDIIWQLLVTGATAAVLLGVCLHRPQRAGSWLTAAGGLSLFAIGSSADAAAWEHAADVTFIIGYVFIGLASAGFVRAMVPEGDPEGLIDGAIVMTAAAIILWGAVFEGGPGGSASTFAAHAENVTACLLPAWVVAMCVRVLFIAGHRCPSAVLLLLCGVTAMGGNLSYLVLRDSGGYAPGQVTDLLWFVALSCFAASALHPSMRTMTVPSEGRHSGLPLGRVTALGLALLAGPIALREAAEVSPGSVPFLGSLLLSGLVCWRFIHLVVELGRSRVDLRALADRQAAVASLSESALGGQPVEALTHRALDLLWRHLPKEARSDAPTGVPHDAIAIRGNASDALRAALPRRSLETDEAAYVQAIANVLDVAAIREQAEGALRHRVLHDGLTGLPNRALLEDRLSTAMARAIRERSSVAVLFIDLDGFKVINDTLGHDAGDEMLVEVTERIRAGLRPSDTLTRFAGDEFVAIVEHDVPSMVWPLAERILERLAPPLLLGGNAVTCGASIGIALGDPGISDPDELIRHADAAMYRAKARGGNCFDLFDDELRDALLHQHALHRDLRGAMERGELTLHYQPVIRLGALHVDGSADDTVVGAEALLRWHHPVHGHVPPSEFIRIAEGNGLISELGDWVLQQALTQLAEWQEILDPADELTLYVNLSPVQLADPRLYSRVRQLLVETGADPARLGVEVTESAVLDEGEHHRDGGLALRRIGIRVALDDFGTGYSSLTHLRSVPLDLLKVDASFVGRISEQEDRAIVTAVAAMARALDVHVLAEGIETPQQLDAVRLLGCDFAQGYHLGRPAPAPDLTALLEQRRGPDRLPEGLARRDRQPEGRAVAKSSSHLDLTRG